MPGFKWELEGQFWLGQSAGRGHCSSLRSSPTQPAGTGRCQTWVSISLLTPLPPPGDSGDPAPPDSHTGQNLFQQLFLTSSWPLPTLSNFLKSLSKAQTSRAGLRVHCMTCQVVPSLSLVVASLSFLQSLSQATPSQAKAATNCRSYHVAPGQAQGAADLSLLWSPSKEAQTPTYLVVSAKHTRAPAN